MAVYIPIENILSDTLYGLWVGYSYIGGFTGKRGKSWSLHLYTSEKGRKRGALNQRRSHAYADLLTFEITTRELFTRSKLTTVIPKELYVDEDVVRLMREKKRKRTEDSDAS